MTIELSHHFTYRKLFRFTLPSIAMMIFSSVYGVVDGYFVSNFAGKTPFAAVNFIMPYLMILSTFAFMFGAGGSALVSKTMGEGDGARANRLFSLITYVCVATGAVLGAVGIWALPWVAAALGATGELHALCLVYGRIILAALPAFMLQQFFQSFFVTAEKPQLGLYITVLSGVANMVLDALFIAVFRWGVAGAALATAISQTVGGGLPLVYFARKNQSKLRLVRARFEGRALLKTCTNGSSELMSNAAFSLVGMLYNMQLMKYAGEDGVAAYGVLMYLSMIFMATFIGYSMGVAPVVGFHYGAGNRGELASLRKKSTVIVLTMSVFMLLSGEVLALPLSRLFVGYDAALFSLTARAFFIFSFSFLFSGVAICGSGFFTALNNGPVSALISFLRTLVFQVAAILLLPLILGTDGIWLSLVAADLLAALVTVACLVVMRKRYGY